MTIVKAGTARLSLLVRRRGGLVTLATVASLVAGLGLTVLGLGAADQAVASFDAASWAWSRGKSELARINGVTARVDTRVDVPQARGHQMQVSQTDRFVILRDLTTGQVSSMDLTTLQIAATTPTTAGLGVTVALHDDAAFVIDTVQGVVSQLDPRTLTPVGEPIRYPPGITGGVFDGKGRLWVAVPGEGTVSAITPAPIASDGPSAGSGGSAASPHLERTISVAPPSHDLDISSLDTGVAVLNRTTNELTTIRGDQKHVTTLTLGGPGALPAHTDGAMVPVTVSDDRHVYVVDGAEVHDFPVPGKGAQLRPAVAWQGFIYCADEQTGTVHVFDATGHPERDIAVQRKGGPLELEVRENYLFINAPDSSTARVVDHDHAVRTVDKYADDVLGGDPPPPPPPEPKTPPKQRQRATTKVRTAPKARPVVSKPGAPRNVRAEAGNAEARVTWRPADANGAAITKYVVEGADRTFEVGAGQRSLQVTGLVNGETYEFAVHAVNAKGDGPPRTSNPVRPTAEVPDPPGQPTAQAQPDGTVVVRWPAADGQGLTIKRYAVTAVADGSSAPLAETNGATELVVPDGELDYGRQYAFSVVAVNERGAGSKSSPLSETVVPFNKPGKPADVTAATVDDKPGQIAVQWGPAENNGRPVTAYRVTAGGRTSEVSNGSRTTVDGLGNGQDVSVEVVAVNEAGPGPAGTAQARTVALPKVQITGASATPTSATIRFNVDAGGGHATCWLSGGGKQGTASCSSMTTTGLKLSRKYTFTVHATNAAGSQTASQDVTTPDVFGIATCNDGESGPTATYCDDNVDGRNGNEIFASTSQQSTQVGWARPGSRLQAFCRKKGTTIDSYIYNHGKKSNWWIRIDYGGGRPYIPFAWLNLEGGDDINILPNC